MTKLFERAVIAAIIGAAACSSSPSSHTVGGHVRGVWDGADGVGLQLQAQGVTSLLTVPSNGDFHFPTPLAPGASYVVTVLASPYLHTCAVEVGGNGVMSDEDITSLSVACTGPEVSVAFAGGHGWTFDASADSQSFDGSVFDDQVALTVTGLIVTALLSRASQAPPCNSACRSTLSLQLGTSVVALRSPPLPTCRGPSRSCSTAAAAPIAQSTYGKASRTGSDFEFGSALALDGDTLVISAPQETVASTSGGADVPLIGAVYVLVRSGDSMDPASAAHPAGGHRWHPGVRPRRGGVGQHDRRWHAGRSQRLGRRRLAISADLGSLRRARCSSVFVRSGTSWTQQAYIKATNTGQLDHFGAAVALDGDVLAVGAPFEDSAAAGVDPSGGQANNEAENAGAAYVYRRTGTSWAPEAYVKPSLSTHDNHFGAVIDLSARHAGGWRAG